MNIDALTDKMIAFAMDELGVKESDLRTLEKNEELRQEIIEKLLWLEVDEIEKNEEVYSKRGQVLSGLLTLLCNEPPMDEDEDVEE